MTLPATIYTAWIDTPEFGAVNVSDDKTSFDDVLDAAMNTSWGDVPFRMIRLDFDVETGEFESGRDVTQAAITAVKVRCNERHLETPDWMVDYIPARATPARLRLDVRA